MDSDKFQSVDLMEYICPVPGIKVLVVDGDLTCVATVSKMLHTLGYEVVTASLASEALSIVEEKKNELNLVLVEVHLPDMEINVLLEKIREISDLPYFLMTTDDNLFSTSKQLCNGAKLYFKKPIVISDLSSLWKFAMWKREDERIASEDVRGFGWHQSQEIIVNKSQECQPFMNTGEQGLQSAKWKEQELLEIGGEQSASLVLKRKRKGLSWTDDLRMKFLRAVELAAINALPNQVHRLMNVPELTKVSNYLQRYRQSLKQEANPIQQHSNTHSSYLNLGSQHLFQTDNNKRKWPLFLERPGVTYNPAFQGYRQIYLCNCIFVQSLWTPAYFLYQEISSGPASTFGQNELCLPWELQGVAHDTSGSGEFMNNGKGETSADISQVENTTDGKVFDGDTFIYSVDDPAEQNEMDFSTLLSYDISQQCTPLLSVPLLPSDEKEHGIFGAEAAPIEEIFYPLNGTQQFSDEDLNIWLSRFNPKELLNDAVA